MDFNREDAVSGGIGGSKNLCANGSVGEHEDKGIVGGCLGSKDLFTDMPLILRGHLEIIDGAAGPAATA
jgi:hypothetical protein